jgi:mono/diheme cytochrome c family protein
MAKQALAVFVALMLSAAGAYAQPRIEKGPIARTSPADAQAMFQEYCAVCHGKTAQGNGPAAAALTKAPADLTRISTRNGGTFPETRVKRFIEGLDEVPAHGTRDMPIWGTLFRSLDQNTAQIRIQGLSDYLKNLQVK